MDHININRLMASYIRNDLATDDARGNDHWSDLVDGTDQIHLYISSISCAHASCRAHDDLAHCDPCLMAHNSSTEYVMLANAPYDES